MDRKSLTPGKITLICGCMFSGKTTQMLRSLKELPDDAILLCKHRIDTRARGDLVRSHARVSRPAVVISLGTEIVDHVTPSHRVIAVDEGHFFGSELVDTAKSLRDKGLTVIVTALDHDSWGRRFPVIERLAAAAQAVHERTAICALCGNHADRTQRLTPILDASMVGGPESYEPRCETCWHPPPESPPPL